MSVRAHAQASQLTRADRAHRCVARRGAEHGSAERHGGGRRHFCRSARAQSHHADDTALEVDASRRRRPTPMWRAAGVLLSLSEAAHHTGSLWPQRVRQRHGCAAPPPALREGGTDRSSRNGSGRGAARRRNPRGTMWRRKPRARRLLRPSRRSRSPRDQATAHRWHATASCFGG